MFQWSICIVFLITREDPFPLKDPRPVARLTDLGVTFTYSSTIVYERISNE